MVAAIVKVVLIDVALRCNSSTAPVQVHVVPTHSEAIGKVLNIVLSVLLATAVDSKYSSSSELSYLC
jgi:hypothetical protein